MKKTLKEIFAEIGHFGNDIGCNDKGGTHSYIDTYDAIFKNFQNGCSILEIGVAMGDSVKLWNDYFSNSKIVANDLSFVFDTEAIKPKNKNKIEYIAADGTKPELMQKLKGQTFDIIIDDGSHMEQDQFTTFNMLKHSMNKGGFYIIEDILALDSNANKFKALHHDCTIIDLRKVKGRFDDVLIIYKF